MDSYVVRIYRRDPKDPRRLVGVVERAEVKGEKAFHDLGELMGIFGSQEPDRGVHKSVRRGKKKRS
jgi:hypothetical protein